MEQAFSVKSYGQAPTPPTPLDQTPHSKSYGSAKALESGSSDLQKQQADWYAQAYAYYNNAVTSGDAQRPSDAEWNDFLNQMNWVYEQLYGGYQGAAPMSGEAPWGDEDTGPSVNEFGGTMGPDGNWVYDTPETEITYQPDGMRHDVYGYTNTLNVPSASAKVTYEITNDGLQPPSQVLKVIVKSAQGESVYYYHNYADPDFKLNINVPKATQVSGALPDDIMNKIKVGKYTAQGSAGDGSEAGVPADHVSDDGTNIYVGNGPDDTIDFGPASDGSDSVNDVQANSNHTFKNDDQVTVEQAPKGSDYDYILTVEHSDGSKDVYHLHKEYNTQLNGIPEHITFIIPGKNGKTSEAHPMIIGEGTDKEVMIVPQPFTDDFSVNGLESKEFNLKFPQKGEKADGKDSKDNKAVKAANTTVEGLAGVTGKSAEQIRAQIFDIYYSQLYKYDADNDGKLSQEEFEKAVKEGFVFPPATPDAKFLQLLANDKTLHYYLELYHSNKGLGLPGDQAAAFYGPIRDRVYELLKAAYPDAKMKKATDDDNIWFNGVQYDVFNQDAPVGKPDPYSDYLSMQEQDV